MNVSRHHADWLSLVEVSGPFVSLPVLLRVFPQGLEPRDSVQAKALRDAYDEWNDNPTIPGSHRAWVLHVLSDALGYPRSRIAEGQTLPPGLEASMPEMGETLRPDFAILDTQSGDTGGQARLLIANYVVTQALDKPVIGKHWKASPATRMVELLHGANVPLGLVTNSEHWMLVYAPPGETTGYASWYGALWLDEPVTLRAFQSLLGVRRFFGVAADSTLLALLKESGRDQQEVTDQLGYQVREAVEVLVQAFDALDKESNRTLLNSVSGTTLYEATLTIMMRLVFLFCAEERGLLHLGKPLYDDNYAVSTLREQLQETADRYGEEVLERRYDGWARLLATFRAVHGGIHHQDLLMQAYGGSLFNPDRYPFLEGRAADSPWRTTAAEPLAVNNRVVLHLLNSLQRLRTKVGAGAAETRRISFRALGVEQIGHVYEGLLDHTAVRATGAVLGIKGTRSKEPEITLTTLESLLAQGRAKLVEHLHEETGRSPSAICRALDEGNSRFDEHKLLMGCDQDEKLLVRLRPFSGLIREDSFGRPLIVLTGSLYVTAGTARRTTGTHYTPPSLTEPIIRRALEPLVYEGPVQGWPRERWKLRLPKAILDLKICDMAMGSGAFLVQACRYLAERLVEAWEKEEKQHPGEVLITPDGKFSEGAPGERLVPADANERIAIACRSVADRCLYGVDISPMATEMAKLSLWLVTVDASRPFTFLDHALKGGDSLIGVSSVKQIENFSLRDGERQTTFATAILLSSVEDAAAKRRALEDLPSNDHAQIERKNHLHAEAETATLQVKVLADCLLAFELRGLGGRAYEEQRDVAADQAELAFRGPLPEFVAYAREQLGGRRTFHWPLEFPEVFARGGFDAFVGNPPFLGGRRIIRTLGEDYQTAISVFFPKTSANADLCIYFLRRSFELLNQVGYLGLVSTKTISEGDTRQGGLSVIEAAGGTIYSAEPNKVWPGEASVLISPIHIAKGTWRGACLLNGRQAQKISTFLTAEAETREAYQLAARSDEVFQGCAVAGEGFLITEDEANLLLAKRPTNCEVVLKYMTGKTFCNDPLLQPTGWIINFHDRSEDESRQYPECFKIIEDRVKPYRDSVRRGAHRKYWWQFGDKRPALYARISGMPRVLANSRVAKHLVFAFLPPDLCYLNTLHVFPFSDTAHFALLQSGIHAVWALRRASSVGVTTQYTPVDCFMTFPFPKSIELGQMPSQLESIGKGYDSLRCDLMRARRLSLTEIYNRFHDRSDISEDMIRLRALQVEIDLAVAGAYGWSDFELGHGFHETKQGVQFTLSEAARREFLDRLLELNHQRHAEEQTKLAVRAASAPAKRGRKKNDANDQMLIDL
jgi:hypothetical protein